MKALEKGGRMGKKRKPESLALEDLGALENYDNDQLVWLREKLIADVERIQAASADHAKQISEHNLARNGLQREQAERARALRAVKHALHLRTRGNGGRAVERGSGRRPSPSGSAI